MATTPVVPAAPSAAPAPAAAPPPAASSAPAAPPTPAPAAPTPSAQPAAGVPPATPAAPAGPQPPAKLNPGEYGNAVDSYQAEVTWKQELAAFKEANPDVAVDDESPWLGTEAPKDETKPAETSAEQPKDETKPADAETPAVDPDAEQFSLEDGPATLTPQALNDLFKSDEALKAAVEANPAAKGALFKMAREHAELSQFKGIFANKDAATFARDTANRTVGLRSQFQLAETPEGMAKAFDSFMQEFAVIGADGKQVVDESGAPVYGDDLYLFGEHIVDRYADNTLAEVEARIAANQYTDEAQRERDNDLKLALSIIKDDLHPADGGKPKDPDLSHLDEKTRGEVQARLDEAKRIEAANETAKAGSKQQSREQVRTQGNAQFFAKAGKKTFEQARGMVEKLRAAGAVIPQWQLDAKVPGQNYTAFDNEVGKAIESHIKADPYEYNKQFQLELAYVANPTPETLQARLAAFDGLLQSRDDTGKSLLNRIVTKLVRQYGQQVQTAGTGTTDTAPKASTEPKPGPAVKPQPMSGDDAYREAQKQLAKEVKDWHSLSDSERMAQSLARQRQLMVGR